MYDSCVNNHQSQLCRLAFLKAYTCYAKHTRQIDSISLTNCASRKTRYSNRCTSSQCTHISGRTELSFANTAGSTWSSRAAYYLGIQGIFTAEPSAKAPHQPDAPLDPSSTSRDARLSCSVLLFATSLGTPFLDPALPTRLWCSERDLPSLAFSPHLYPVGDVLTQAVLACLSCVGSGNGVTPAAYAGASWSFTSPNPRGRVGDKVVLMGA